MLDSDHVIYLLQEMPRREAGWQTDQKDGWVSLSHRHEDRWRGAGILYREKSWRVVRRIATDRGCWFRMRHVEFANEVWVGTAHIDPGCTQQVHREAVHEHLSRLRATTLPIILACDINSHIRWEHDDDGVPQPLGRDGKTVGFLDAIAGRGLQLVTPSPDSLHRPTSRPRQEGRVGRQIDCLCYKGLSIPRVEICVDTHRCLGTDHELLRAFARVQG